MVVMQNDPDEIIGHALGVQVTEAFPEQAAPPLPFRLAPKLWEDTCACLSERANRAELRADQLAEQLFSARCLLLVTLVGASVLLGIEVLK
jgi:hypothetical protein